MNHIDTIKNRMAERGLTPKDLEPAIGSRGHVWNVLNGKRAITMEMARKLMELLDLEADTFLKPTNKKSK